MELKKYIVTHEANGHKYGNAVIVTQTYSRFFGNYKELIDEAIRDFGFTDEDNYPEEIECLIANKDNKANAGRIAITFRVTPNLTMKGYENTTKSPIY